MGGGIWGSQNMKLRDYQAECIQEVKNRLPTVNSQLVQLPTGSGKTVIFWHLLRDLNKRALIIAPTRELVEQIQDTGGEVVYHRDIYAKRSSWVPAEWPQFTTMTIKAAAMLFKKQPERLPNIDYLVFDEAHRSQATQAAELIEHYKESGVKIIGLTATPERLDGKSLMDLYEVLTYKKTLVDLIRHGHLVDLECYRVKTRFKLPGARMSAGDISPAALRELDLDARNEIILKTFLDNCLDKKTLIFCLSIDHANEIARQLREKGVSAAAVHGSMPSKERKQIINDFKSGKIRALCNCQLLTEGFDDPSIEALVLARPTKSKALYCQMIGRGVRPYEGKEVCFVYDITDEIHDICTFNVLGEFKEKGEFEFEQGERLLDACDRRLLSVDEVEVVVELVVVELVEVEVVVVVPEIVRVVVAPCVVAPCVVTP